MTKRQLDREDEDLIAYFTDMEDLRAEFSTAISAKVLDRHLLHIHGQGGIGKTSLLRMFRIECLTSGVPVALAAIDDANVATSVDLLAAWARELKSQGVELTGFEKKLGRYLAAQGGSRHEQERTGRAASLRAFAESAVGEAAGVALGTAVPFAGAVVGVAAAGVAMRGSMDWFGRGGSTPDRELLLAPSRELTAEFVETTAKVASKRRLVLMVDSFEKAGGLSPWLRDVEKCLHEDILLVIAGRKMLDWTNSWKSRARWHRLDEMTTGVMQDLISRYYRSQLGRDPEPGLAEQIAAFARGLPLAVTTAVQVSANYESIEFEEVEAPSLADLLRKLLDGVPLQMRQLLRAAAALRYFDKEMVRVVAERPDLDAEYEDLTAFPFVSPAARETPGRSAYRIHDAVREFLDRNLELDDPVMHRAMHGRASIYFEERVRTLNVVPGLSDEWQRLQRERVYHLLRVDEDAATALLRLVFGTCLPYFRYEPCQAILNDADEIGIHDQKALQRLELSKLQLIVATNSFAYLDGERVARLVANRAVDPDTAWETLWLNGEYLAYTARPREAGDSLWLCLETLRGAGLEETAAGCRVMVDVATNAREHHGGRLTDEAREALLERALEIALRLGDRFGAYDAYVELGHLRFSHHRYEQAEVMWRHALAVAKESENHERIADGHNRLVQALLGLGRFDEAQTEIDAAMSAASHLPDTLGGRRDKEMYIRRHLAMLYHGTGQFELAIATFRQSTQTYRDRKSTNGLFRNVVLLSECLYEARRTLEVRELLEEGDALVQRSRMGEWVSRWLVLRGNLRIDEGDRGSDAVACAAELYRDSLVAGLRWDRRTAACAAARILVRLDALADGGEEAFARSVLGALCRQLETREIDGGWFALVAATPPWNDDSAEDGADELASIIHYADDAPIPRPRRAPKPWDGL